MAIRVTNAKTSHGRYYAAGDVIDNPSSRELSLARMHKWEHVDDSKPLSGLNKTQLLQLAEDGGLETAGLTKKQLIEILT